MNQEPRRQDTVFDTMLEHVTEKMKANKEEVQKAKRTRLTVHRSARGKITVDLETKL